MPSINIYLNFNGNAADAIQFYHSVLGGELFLQRMSETPYGASLPDHEKNRLMHGAITLDNGHLMVSDILESAGHQLRVGNNTYVSLAVDSRAEADRIMT